MYQVFSGNTADELWQQAAEAFRKNCGSSDPDSRTGATQELLHVTLSLNDPRQRWVASRRPAMNPAFAITEVVWIMAGRQDSRFLNFWNPGLPRYAGDGPTYEGAYGHRLRCSFGLDQLERAHHALKAVSQTRQIVLQIWDPRLDLPQASGAPASEDVPCNICSLLKIRDGRLHWTQIIRSNDLFLGVPHNFVQFTSMQEILAGWLGIEPGPYFQLSDSLHLYDRNVDVLAKPPGPVALPNLDTLACPKEDSDKAFADLVSRMNRMTKPGVDAQTIREACRSLDLPKAHENMLMVVAADAARRVGARDLADNLAERCDSKLLRQLWTNWLQRTRTN